MIFSRLVAALGAILLAGCASNDIPEEIASIFIEAPASIGGSMKQEVRLPVSQLAISVLPRALVPAEEILGTQAITSGDPDLRQEFLLVQLDRKAAVDVMNYSKEAVGRQFQGRALRVVHAIKRLVARNALDGAPHHARKVEIRHRLRGSSSPSSRRGGGGFSRRLRSRPRPG